MTTAISQCQSLESLLRWKGSSTETFARAHRERKRERSDIARGLRDRIFQGFSGASSLLRNSAEQKPGGSPIKVSAGRALALIQAVLKKARTAMQGPSRAAFNPLERAFASFGEEAPRCNDILFRIFANGKPRDLDLAVQEQVYLMGRAALLNAFQHSRATTIEAEIEYLPRRLRVFVRDDGCGIDPAHVCSPDSHRGLAVMQECAADISAKVRVWSRRGAGTEVEISVRGV
jgi:signal transduction histidine kinase